MSLLFESPILTRWKRWDSGSRQRYSSYWSAIAARDPYFASVYMTVELVFGDGTTLRLARTPITTTSGIDGTVYPWEQGLVEEPEITAEVQMGSQAAAARTLTLTLPTGLVDVSALIARGAMLAGAAEVSLQVDGGDYDQRLVLMRGDMAGGVSFGNPTERLQVQISDPRMTTSLLIPDIVVDVDRWPDTAEAAVGMRYPIVINGYPWVPCLRVDDSATLHFLICKDGRDLDLTTTYVNGVVAAGGYLPATREEMRDALGTPVLAIDFGSSAGPWEDNDSVYADVTLSAGKASLSAVKVIERLLQTYTSLGRAGLNPDLFSFADAQLPGHAPKILINASGDQTVSALDFVESTLLGSFPMIHMIYEGRGMGPVVIDRRLPAVTTLTGRIELLERNTQYTETPKANVYNSFSLRYNFNAQDNTWGGTITRNASNDDICRLSFSMVGGERPFSCIDSPVIFNDALATAVVDWLVAHYALPTYDVEWTVLPATLLRVRIGQNLQYSDPEFNCFSDCRATVTGLTYSRGKASISLKIWHPVYA